MNNMLDELESEDSTPIQVKRRSIYNKLKPRLSKIIEEVSAEAHVSKLFSSSINQSIMSLAPIAEEQKNQNSPKCSKFTVFQSYSKTSENYDEMNSSKFNSFDNKLN